MKKLHQILQLTLLVYFGAFLIFFIGFDTFGGIFGMEEITSDSMVTVILVGFVLFLLSWGAGYMAFKNLMSRIKKLEQEMDKLKARLYDHEHPHVADPKAPAEREPIRTNPKIQDPEPSNLPPRQNFTKE